MSQRAIAGLVLAAGESSRMGQDKALLGYRGRTFLEDILQSLRDAGIERITVVLGHHAEEIRRQVDLTARRWLSTAPIGRDKLHHFRQVFALCGRQKLGRCCSAWSIIPR